MKKRRKQLFIRSFCMTSVIIYCLIFGVMAAARAYENTVRIGYGKYRSAIEFNDYSVRIFDYEIKI
ncbi:MAG: hypothetical protein II357_01160 [Clostridia bacterium]|nr:hypothetical protein [Clostridia bacterium]